MNSNQIKYYLELYKEKNITRAAENLMISRQALTKAISSLEKEFQTQLLYGTHNGVAFTDAGEYFYKRAQIMRDDYLVTLESMKTMADSGKIDIRIGFDYMTTYLYDDNALLPFLHMHNELHFTRIIRTPDQLEKECIENNHDVIISHIDVPASVPFFHISHIPVGVLVPTTNPLSRKKYLLLNDFEGQKVYATGGNLKFVKECNAFFRAVKSSANCQPTATNEIFTNLNFIQKENALFITTGYYRKTMGKDSGFHFLPIRYNGQIVLPNHDVYFYCSYSLLQREYIKDLINYLRKVPIDFSAFSIQKC